MDKIICWLENDTGNLFCLYPENTGLVKITPWADGLDVFLKNDGRWAKVNRIPSAEIFAGVYESLQDPKPLDEFLGQIPWKLREVACFFRQKSITAFRFMRLSPHAKKLARKNQPLFVILASLYEGDLWPDEEMTHILGLSQSKMLRAIGEEGATWFLARSLAKQNIDDYLDVLP